MRAAWSGFTVVPAGMAGQTVIARFITHINLIRNFETPRGFGLGGVFSCRGGFDWVIGFRLTLNFGCHVQGGTGVSHKF